MSRPIVPTFPAQGRVSDLFRGFSLPFRALGLIARHPKLRRLSLLAAAVTMAALAGLVWVLVRYTGTVLSLVWQMPETTLGRLFWHIAFVLTFIVLLAVGANTVPALVLAPLQDPLSEATEAACGRTDERAFSVRRAARETATSLAHTVLRVGHLLAGQLVLSLIHFWPGVGTVLWPFAANGWTMIWLAAEHLDSPLTRHGVRFSDVRRVVWRRLPLSLGFGAAVWLLLWVPVVNFFFIPAAVVGGTLLSEGLFAAGAVSRHQ